MLDRMERLEVSVTMGQPPNAPNPTMQPRRVPRRVQVNDDFDDNESLRDNREEEEVRPRARNNHNNGNNGVKLKIPSFHGRMDPEAYLDWEKKTELVFDCNDYTESKKLKLAVAVFEDYAITCWDDTKQK
ncbi:Myosin heavy chain, fast skeletal muscle like [Melia azedarach]|nr:Myosin heavy chain, fast skeletal muscle like [Melia azedarach]